MKRFVPQLILVFIFASFMNACGPKISPEETQPYTPTQKKITATSSLPTEAPGVAFSSNWPPTPQPLPPGKIFVVNTATDNGPGSLRQAMLDARRGDVITFDPLIFPPNFPTSIILTSSLPEISQGNLTIDASNAGVILDGSLVTGHGLSISSNSNTIRGLQIVGFSDAGIGLFGGAKFNVIGGDPNIGIGLLGQGNLISGNGNFGIGLWNEDTSYNTIQGNYIGINMDGTKSWGHARDGIHSNGATQNLITGNVIGGNESAGVYLCCVLDGYNTVADNLIGVGSSGIPLGNGEAGILIDRTSHNVVGPSNIIAHNLGDGIGFWEGSSNNTVTQNSIHDNGRRGIAIEGTMQHSLLPPLIITFDIQAGKVSGTTCPNCTVEIFSDSGEEGSTYEGQVEAKTNGSFTFDKATPLAGPFLTAIAIAPNGSSSEFSRPTLGNGWSLSLQASNTLPLFRLLTKPSNELADNRIGASYLELGPQTWTERVVTSALDLGLKHMDVQFGDVEPPIDWSLNEYELPKLFDGFVDSLPENGIALNYMLHFWDTAGHAAGEELGNPRFQNEEEVQEFLDYVRFFVRHFKGRIPYYTIWSEPDYCGDDGIKCILPHDYIELARQVIPVIREEDPQASVVSAPYTFYDGRISTDLNIFITSDVVSQFDIISLHPIYEVTPDNEHYGNFYYQYPAIIQELKRTTSAHGFTGELWGTELTWNSKEICKRYPYCWDYLASDPRAQGMAETDLQAAKYYARGIVMELGMDMGVGLGGLNQDASWSYPTIRNLSTVMAGNKPIDITVEIISDATNITSYGFSLPNGDKLFAVWSDCVAVDEDPGIPSTISFIGFSGWNAIGIDVINGFEQELISTNENGNLIIYDLFIKDYPIIIRLSK